MTAAMQERDWRFIVDSIYRINSHKNPETLEEVILEALWALIPARQIMLNRTSLGDRGKLEPRSVKTIGEEAKYMEEFLAGGYSNEDPFFLCWNGADATITFKDTQMMDDEYREQTRLYKEIYFKQGIYYALRSCLVFNGKPLAMISCFKSKEDGDFSDRDLQAMSAIAPHIALRLGRPADHRAESRSGNLLASLSNRFGYTRKEAEVASLVMDGHDDAQMVDLLGISKSTLKKHLHSIYRKTSVQNRSQLILALAKCGQQD